ncbi:MAG: TonB-dependent receptor [Bacteroidota bacterium]
MRKINIHFIVKPWQAVRAGLLTALLAIFCFSSGLAQSMQVSGTVTDEAGSPLPGVSVVVQGTANGVLTEENGSYSIRAEKGATLVYTLITYKTQTKTVGDASTMDVVMEITTLQEVVVTGYTSQRKRDITGAVSVIEADDMNEISAPSFIQKLDGRSSGVTVSTSGAPGAGSRVRIRGISSFQNNDPLYIIDGVPSTDNFANGINPNDIETIQVLKDASAASIYGARANNGVIIITTKKGTVGKTSVSYDGYVGVQAPVGRYDLIVDPTDYSEVVYRAHENAGLEVPAEVPYAAGRGVIPAYLYDWSASGYPGTGSVDESTYRYPDRLIHASNPNGTDWWDEVFDPALITEHNVGISGGTANNQFFISANYFNQQGTMINTFFERASVRANSNFKAGKFTFGENFSLARSQSIGQPGGNQREGNVMTQILKAQSIIPVLDVSGNNFAGGKANGLSNGSNPVAVLERASNNVGTFYKVLGNVYGEFEVIDGLTARTSLGIDYADNFTNGFSFPTWEESEPNTVNGFNERWDKFFNWTWTNTLNYKKNFAGQHDLNVLVGYEAIRNSSRTIGGSLANYFTDNINAWYLQTGLADPSSRNVFSFGGFGTLASIFAKVDYSFGDKYIASATVRRDGSSNFGVNKYGTFPAFSLGWRLSSEPFMQNASWVEDLKIRGGWGVTGNQNIGGGRQFDQFGGGPESSFYDITGSNNSLATGFALNSIGNPNAAWEENVSTNIGFDASLFGGKWLVVFDVYRREVNGLLFNPAQPATGGLGSPPFVNIGDMINEGIDFSVTYNNTFSNGLGLELGLNGTTYRNEIVKIDGVQESFFSGTVGGRIGNLVINVLNNPISTFYGFTDDGIFRSEEEVNNHADQPGKAIGRIRFRDLNEDGVINDDDRGIIGSPHPAFTGGLNIGLNYQGFDLSAFLFTSIGNEIFNYNKLFEVFRFFNTNVRTEVLDRSFHPTNNPDGDFPILDENDTFSEQPNTFYIEDGSYLRLRNLQIGYTLPAATTSSIGLSRLRVYLQAQNLLTITNYSGIDPALSSFETGDLQIGYDFGNFPAAQIYSIGVNVGF